MHDYERMYREACWHLGVSFDHKLYEKFLESEEAKGMQVRLEAEMYYTARNWVLAETTE